MSNEQINYIIMDRDWIIKIGYKIIDRIIRTIILNLAHDIDNNVHSLNVHIFMDNYP